MFPKFRNFSALFLIRVAAQVKLISSEPHRGRLDATRGRTTAQSSANAAVAPRLIAGALQHEPVLLHVYGTLFSGNLVNFGNGGGICVNNDGNLTLKSQTSDTNLQCT